METSKVNHGSGGQVGLCARGLAVTKSLMSNTLQTQTLYCIVSLVELD
jgi:hypothetical protein